MSAFTTPLRVEAVDDDYTKWKVIEPFEYYTDMLDPLSVNRVYIEVEEGFITNFASIPRILWNILPPYGKYGKASVIHDYLYSKASDHLNISREKADKIFLEAMGVLRVSRFKRYSMYYAVKWFGAENFKTDD